MAYRLTDEVAEQVRKLIEHLGCFDPHLMADRSHQILFKKSDEINYKGLQYWLSEQPSKRAFDDEILRCQINPIRRMEKKGVEDWEYLEDLIDAVNSLRERVQSEVQR